MTLHPRVFCLLSAVAACWLPVPDLNAQIRKSDALDLVGNSDRKSGFESVPPKATGITFIHQIAPARSLTNQMLLDGSGVALADVDGDGRVDIFFGASSGGSQLWKNLGNWKFEDWTEKAFPGRKNDLAGDITGTVLADVNGDGKADLILNSHADGLRILLNDGNGTFHSLPFPQARARGGHSVALADVDGDGWVDIYVCNYRQRALMDMPSARATFKTVNGISKVATLDGRPANDPDLTNRFVVGPSGELEELGEPDVLYLNQRGTNFVAVSWTEGAFLDENGRSLANPPWDWGLAAQFCDVNDDGRPDFYVCNDFQSPDRFWLNESSPGRVRFRLAPRGTLRHTSLFSMGVDFADINRDGRWDFVVLDMLSPDHVRRLTTLDGTSTSSENPLDPNSRPQSDANTLFLQRPDGSFAEIANFAGIMATDWSWTPAFLDVDLDGWPDLLVSAGQERASRDLDIAEHMKRFRRTGLRTDAQIFRERQKFPPQPAPLKAFRNRCTPGANRVPVFEDMSAPWGFDFRGVSHGMALADLDGDGDLDVVVNHLNAPAGLFRNVSAAPRISVRLIGQSPNSGAVGARLRFWSGAPELPQSAQIAAGARYLSSDDLAKTFACPGAGTGWLEIRWPSGQITTQSNLLANHYYEIVEPKSDSPSQPSAVGQSSSGRLRFAAKALSLPPVRRQPADFDLQPTMPRLASARFPSLALSRDKEFHLWVGGADQPLWQLSGSSDEFRTEREMGDVRSSGAILRWGAELIVTARSNQTRHLIRLNTQSGISETISTNVTAIRCLAADHDEPTRGACLFAGGGAREGDYPNSGESELFRWDEDRFRPFVKTNLGLVTGALFSDLDGDGGKELVTVSEWGAPRILGVRDHQLVGWDPSVKLASSSSVRLSSMNGWWQSISAADVDRDGRMDLVLGNWGLNSPYALYTGSPSIGNFQVRTLSLFHGKIDAGVRTCVEGYWNSEGRILPIRGRADITRNMPWVGEAFPTYRSFAAADLAQILGERSRAMNRLDCTWLSSILLLNRGDHFEVQPLPDFAQLGPIFALSAADFDGDGVIDFYAAQGFFGYNNGMTRDDAGEGVFLLGRGNGAFDAVSTGEAGFRLSGEQRAVLAPDLNGDRRPDLIIGEDGGPVTILLNRKP